MENIGCSMYWKAVCTYTLPSFSFPNDICKMDILCRCEHKVIKTSHTLTNVRLGPDKMINQCKGGAVETWFVYCERESDYKLDTYALWSFFLSLANFNLSMRLIIWYALLGGLTTIMTCYFYFLTLQAFCLSFVMYLVV